MSKIAIRGGHTERCTGAISSLANELTLNRELYPLIIKYLKQLGHEVLDVTPPVNYTDNKYTDLNYGVNKANSWGADLFISVHFNKAYNSYTGAIGSEVCVYSNNAIAQRVCDGLGELGFKNRGQKVHTDYVELKNTTMPAMIIETMFIEATEDVALYKRLGADAVAKKIAEKVANKSLPTPAPTPAPSKGDGFYRVVTGSYSVKDNAVKEQGKLKTKGVDTFLAWYEDKKVYRVIAGSYEEKANAEKRMKELNKIGIDSFLAYYNK